MAGEGKRCGPSLHIGLAVALKSCVIDMARKEMTKRLCYVKSSSIISY